MFIGLLFVLLWFVNEKSPKENTQKTTKQITKINNIEEKTITFDDVTLKMKLKKYVAYNLFQIEYDTSKFEIAKMSDNSYIIKNINDKKIYVKIIPLNEKDYLNDISKKNNNDMVNYFYGNNVYLKIIVSDIDDKLLNAEVNYMISTIMIK